MPKSNTSHEKRYDIALSNTPVGGEQQKKMFKPNILGLKTLLEIVFFFVFCFLLDLKMVCIVCSV